MSTRYLYTISCYVFFFSSSLGRIFFVAALASHPAVWHLTRSTNKVFLRFGRIYRFLSPNSRTIVAYAPYARNQKFATPENVSTPNLNSYYRSFYFSILSLFDPHSSPTLYRSFSFFVDFVFEYFSPVLVGASSTVAPSSIKPVRQRCQLRELHLETRNSLLR